MRWLWLLLRDPATALDWHDPHGKLDHGKVVPDLILVVLVLILLLVSLRTQAYPPASWGLIVISAAFGSSSWRALLRSRVLRVTDAQRTTVIRERRDAATGTEPTP